MWKYDFEYDDQKRLLKKRIRGLHSGSLDTEYTLHYSGNEAHPYKISQIVEDLSGGDRGFSDTTFITYRNGYVVSDSTELYGPFARQQYARVYDSIAPGRYRFTIRRYSFYQLHSISGFNSAIWWNAGNLVSQMDTSFTGTTTFAGNFTYDNSINPFKRLYIPYLLPSLRSFGQEDLKIVALTVNPCNNNFLSWTDNGGRVQTISYSQYNVNNMPVSAQLFFSGMLPWEVRYFYTD
jgi:hypothetical protein